MSLTFGFVKETAKGECRVAMTPEGIGKLLKSYPDAKAVIQKGAGEGADFSDDAYKKAGAILVASADDIYATSDIVARVTPPAMGVAAQMKKGALLLGNLDPFNSTKLFAALAKNKVNALSMERIPRTSRAQAMDTLSSQASLAGYRAVIEASSLYKGYFPLMMTSAGSSRPANVIVLGVGVAGLQAIATARRLGAAVQAFDVRPEVKEQVESLGAKFIDIDLGEDGSGEGGYAKELSADAKAKQQAALQEVLKKADVVVTTALIPGREAPELITEDTVKGMKDGSIIVDMAAAAGGNCKLTEANKIVIRHGVSLVGHTNYPSMAATDASHFYAGNVLNLMALLVKDGRLVYDREDDIVDAALSVFEGKVES